MEIQIDTRDFDRVLRPLAGMAGEVDKAIRAALKRTGANMGTNIARQIKEHSFLKSGDIRQALSKPLLTGTAGSLRVEERVASRQLALDRFRLVPRRVTARKRMRSIHWPRAGYQIGPGEPVRYPDGGNGLSKAFVTRLNGRLFLMQRRGRTLERMFGYSVQYFAAFDATSAFVMRAARTMFEQRLRHEVQHRLEKLK
ncbi:hypothetical protein [Desulfovibrio sp. ZJ200]|uniref:hypothetical protein n=1 Tax=Desulfovibrio sp. ZJ200 TaxID=2709792 RepID=UPI0013EA4B88|nr:hypothetical protein [Desulfovibrio sp. ZJ200]